MPNSGKAGYGTVTVALGGVITRGFVEKLLMPSDNAPGQAELIARVADLVNADSRIRAAWLEGSFGRGDADRFSDIDLHLLLTDEDAVTGITEDLRAFLSPVTQLAYDKRVFGQLYHLITDEGARLDIALQSGETASVNRAQSQVLKGDALLLSAPPPAFDAARSMPADIREFWRVVLLLPVALGRGELLRAWQGGIGFQVNTLINLMVRARGNPQARGAKKLNMQMRDEDRARLETLLALPRFDRESIARVTLNLAALMREIGPACCETLGEPYPTAWEAVVLRCLRRDLPPLGLADVLNETLGA